MGHVVRRGDAVEQPAYPLPGVLPEARDQRARREAVRALVPLGIALAQRVPHDRGLDELDAQAEILRPPRQIRVLTGADAGTEPAEARPALASDGAVAAVDRLAVPEVVARLDRVRAA